MSNGHARPPLKERPDFIAGYDAGLADGKRCAERDAAEPAVQGEPVAWTDAKLRGIASDYFPDAKDWPAAMLCLRHLLMEQAAHPPSQPPREPLSDAKLWELWQVRGQGPIDFARAVLAAQEQKT